VCWLKNKSGGGGVFPFLFFGNRCWEVKVPQIEACVSGDGDSKEGSETS